MSFKTDFDYTRHREKRRKNFAANAETWDDPDFGLTIAVKSTTNSTQFNITEFYPEEWQHIIKAVQVELDKIN